MLPVYKRRLPRMHMTSCQPCDSASGRSQVRLMRSLLCISRFVPLRPNLVLYLMYRPPWNTIDFPLVFCRLAINLLRRACARPAGRLGGDLGRQFMRADGDTALSVVLLEVLSAALPRLLSEYHELSWVLSARALRKDKNIALAVLHSRVTSRLGPMENDCSRARAGRSDRAATPTDPPCGLSCDLPRYLRSQLSKDTRALWIQNRAFDDATQSWYPV